MKNKQDGLNLQTSSEAKVANEFPIVGIGASAGGLEPIEKLLENLPVQTGLSFVVIQHLAPGQQSMLPEILSRSTKMKVQQVKDAMHVEQDHVYVIPPGETLTLENGCLKLLAKNKFSKPINDFMISLASEQKTRAIGIVLSGTGNDGTEGLKAIKAEGGITFAQDPNTAQYPDMPKNAVAAEAPDFVLSPEQIAKELGRIVNHPQLIFSETKASEQEKAETDLKKIIMLLKTSFGVDFTHYKETTVNRRITRRMVISKTENMKTYVEYLRTKPSEQQSLFDDLLIGVTRFFREPDAFLALKEKVFPELVKNRSPDESMRVWVSGCSTGEEVYSLAIAINEFLEEKALTEIQVQIFGTDANEKNIEKARRGTYPKTIDEHVSENRLKRFFTSDNGNYRITKFIRDMCIFSKQDITTDPPFSNIDLIMCRNVLIYFDSYLHEKVLPIFHYGLKPNSFLVLGESESIGKFQYLFEPFIPKGLIYRKKQAQPQVMLDQDLFVPSAVKKATKPLAKIDLLTILGEDVDRLITTEYGPATLLVNNNLDILVFRGDVTPYLSPESGTASLNISKIIRKEFRSQIQTAVYRAKKQNNSFKETVHFREKEAPRTVNIEIRPLKKAEYYEPFYLVLFTEVTLQDAQSLQEGESVASSLELESLKDRQIRELREDLEAAKESMQSFVEGQEATNEELHSSMEEVQSSNEELQSTNEELETAKEELQSGNEELQTLNEELKNRNQALGRLTDDLANLQTNIDSPVLIVDNNLKTRRFTTSAQELLKISPSDIGSSITNINLGLHIEDLEKTTKEVITELTVVNREVMGTEGRWYQMRIRPYLTEDKKIDGAVLSFSDITERKTRNEHEIESLTKYPTENPNAVFRVDQNGTISYHNPAAESLLTEWNRKFGERATDQLKNLVFDALNLNKQIELEETFGDKTFLLLLVPSASEGYLNIYGIDISRRKKAEESLRKQASLIDLSPDAIIEKKVDDTITFWSQGAQSLYGWTKEEAIGQKSRLLLKTKFPEQFREILNKLEVNGRWSGEKIHYSKLGREVIVESHWLATCNVQGKIVEILETNVDITERKRLQTKLEEYSKNLEKLVEERTSQLKDAERLGAIGATAGMVGHDIRNPLQAITSDVYLLKTELVSMPESEDKKSVIESLDGIEKNVDYINKIVADLQDFARPLKPTVEEADLKLIVDELLKKNGLPENVKVNVNVESAVEKVRTDAAHINRILYNLVNNAVQAMPKGGKLTIHAYKESNDDVLVIVKDTGVGIPEGVKNKLFTPMFTTKSKGQGFGLPVVKRMTEALGGTVTFESQEGKGATFIIRLPQKK